MTKEESPCRASGGLDAIRIDMIGTDQHTDQAHALLDQVDGCAVQLEPIISTLVALQDEAAVGAQQQAGFVDGLAGQRVASIARAA